MPAKNGANVNFTPPSLSQSFRLTMEGIKRRRAAALRLPPLDNNVRDPAYQQKEWGECEAATHHLIQVGLGAAAA